MIKTKLVEFLSSRPNEIVEIQTITEFLYGCDGPAERHALRNRVYYLRQNGETRIESRPGILIWRPNGVVR